MLRKENYLFGSPGYKQQRSVLLLHVHGGISDERGDDTANRGEDRVEGKRDAECIGPHLLFSNLPWLAVDPFFQSRTNLASRRSIDRSAEEERKQRADIATRAGI